MTPDELVKINEEIDFWETNMFSICILKKVPEQVPDNFSIKELLVLFEEERDYYTLVRRLALLKVYRDNPDSFIEKN
jgi:hypothetical protein